MTKEQNEAETELEDQSIRTNESDQQPESKTISNLDDRLEQESKPEKKTKKSTTKKKTTLKKASTKPSEQKQASVVDDFLNRNQNLSDRILVNKFCIEQNKKILLPSDWSVCYKYYKSGDIKDLLEYIHTNIRSRT